MEMKIDVWYDPLTWTVYCGSQKLERFSARTWDHLESTIINCSATPWLLIDQQFMDPSNHAPSLVPQKKKTQIKPLEMDSWAMDPAISFNLLYPLHQNPPALTIKTNKTNPLHQTYYPQRSRESHSFGQTKKILKKI